MPVHRAPAVDRLRFSENGRRREKRPLRKLLLQNKVKRRKRLRRLLLAKTAEVNRAAKNLVWTTRCLLFCQV